MNDRITEARARYERALHGVQSAIQFEISLAEPGRGAASPKHLRVGVDSAHVTDLAIVELLIAKGVFSEEEYYGAVASAMERELARYEARHPGMRFW